MYRLPSGMRLLASNFLHTLQPTAVAMGVPLPALSSKLPVSGVGITHSMLSPEAGGQKMGRILPWPFLKSPREEAVDCSLVGEAVLLPL